MVNRLHPISLEAQQRALGRLARKTKRRKRFGPIPARIATFSGEHKHLDHGYAVTSHSAQGATADRVLIHAESTQSSALVNQRFAYVAGSRMREGLQVYTDDAQRLEGSFSRGFDKTAAVSDRTASNAHVAASRSDSTQSLETQHQNLEMQQQTLEHAAHSHNGTSDNVPDCQAFLGRDELVGAQSSTRPRPPQTRP